MLRFFNGAFSAVVLLLALTSLASAGERYVEIWNPPEARIGVPAAKCAPKAHGATVTTRNAGKLAPRRVADPLSRPALSRRAPAIVAKKPVVPPSIYIPRLITPEGNVLRV